ncbi:hypothetical protein DFH08DRAFT_960107 [Mycena albidolilacea]|uniref:SWIM-type domain-containing protein n=1 Tax=Mycena albidolilacea TaxID=1033008 RepID=A0AAD7ESD4_9AGAR|nr:hypothetical protein DFH08DRAFT_960107 [Mycena albidolilacea]
MSDFDWAQINACWDVYHSLILLCWWHVLHAWQQHFHISQNPELWELLKKWVRMTHEDEFNAAWAEIQRIAPPKFVVYLKQYWMPAHVVRMWSAVHRKDRTIFECCDTNMLIEVWHLQGKRNRRLDLLLSKLLTGVLPYYALKQRRQELGFEGPDIEVKKHQDICKRAKIYVKGDIEQVTAVKYAVPSKSTAAKIYEVDLDTYMCTCLDYPLIAFCKHICVVQNFFHEDGAARDFVDGDGEAREVEDVAARDFDANLVAQRFDEAGAAQEDLPVSPNVPSLSALEDSVPGPFDAPFSATLQKAPILTSLAEKLERLAARLRRRQKNTLLASLTDLEDALDAMLQETDDGSVLLSSQHIQPNTKVLFKHTLNAMMPGIKTKRAPAGDRSYGAGASSGSKAGPKQPRQKPDTVPLPPVPPLPTTVPLSTIPPLPSATYPGWVPPAPAHYMLTTPHVMYPPYTYTPTAYSTHYYQPDPRL